MNSYKSERSLFFKKAKITFVLALILLSWSSLELAHAEKGHGQNLASLQSKISQLPFNDFNPQKILDSIPELFVSRGQMKDPMWFTALHNDGIPAWDMNRIDMHANRFLNKLYEEIVSLSEGKSIAELTYKQFSDSYNQIASELRDQQFLGTFYFQNKKEYIWQIILIDFLMSKYSPIFYNKYLNPSEAVENLSGAYIDAEKNNRRYLPIYFRETFLTLYSILEEKQNFINKETMTILWATDNDSHIFKSARQIEQVFIEQVGYDLKLTVDDENKHSTDETSKQTVAVDAHDGKNDRSFFIAA